MILAFLSMFLNLSRKGFVKQLILLVLLVSTSESISGQQAFLDHQFLPTFIHNTDKIQLELVLDLFEAERLIPLRQNTGEELAAAEQQTHCEVRLRWFFKYRLIPGTAGFELKKYNAFTVKEAEFEDDAGNLLKFNNSKKYLSGKLYQADAYDREKKIEYLSCQGAFDLFNKKEIVLRRSSNQLVRFKGKLVLLEKQENQDTEVSSHEIPFEFTNIAIPIP